MALQLLGAPSDPALLDLPWSTPLEEWPEDHLVLLPRGISRHVVRFVRLGGSVYAVTWDGNLYAFSLPKRN